LDAVPYLSEREIANQIKVYFLPENPAGFTTNIKPSATGIALVCRNVVQK
jgi:hypothetical protein